MGLFSSLYTGVSALQTYGNSIQVIGNNIANISTIGFKGSRAEFSAILGQSIASGSGGSELGRGVSLERVSRSFAQGSFNNTDRLTDLGIDGQGFFVLSDGAQTFYTRNGQFDLDREGFLVNSRGLKVQGNLFNSTGQALGQGDLQIGASSAPPNPTSDGIAGSGVDIDFNLDSRETILLDGMGALIPFSPVSAATAEATSNFSTTITVYDSLGDSHAATVYFERTTDTTWDYYVTTPAGEVNNTIVPAGAELWQAGNGTLTFNNDGTLASQTVTNPATFDFKGGAAAGQVIGFEFAGASQFAQESSVSSQLQDGFAAGSLSSVSISGDGNITGFFSNGRNINIGQIILADFPNESGLAGLGGSLFAETIESGGAVVGGPNVGGIGTLQTFTLELSNVDLANEFVNLVTTQRAYQANSQVISTADDLLNEVVNIVR